MLEELPTLSQVEVERERKKENPEMKKGKEEIVL